MRRNNWMHLGVLLLLVLGGGATVTTLLKAETPYGRVTGVLTMAESGIPLAGVRVELDEDTKRDDGHDYVAHTDAQGRFTVEHVAVGTYKLSARTDAHAAPDVTVEVREDTVADASTVLKPVPPFVSLEKLEHVYTTRESIALRVHGFVPEKSLELTLYRFTDKVAAKAWNGWLPAHVATDNGKADLAALAHASSLHRVRTTTVAVTQRDVEGVFRQALTLGTLPAGTYLLAAQAGVVRDTALVAVTDMGMVVKNNGKRLLAYTVSLLTGKAQPDVAVTVQFGDNVVAHRSTDDEGLCDMQTPHHAGDDTMLVVGRDGENMAVAATSVNGDSEEDEQGKSFNCYTYTDRPIYRPGHTVYFKSIMRQVVGKGFRVPGPRDVTVQVSDSRDNSVYHDTLHSNAFGAVDGAFQLPDAALPGTYGIDLTVDGQTHNAYFSVAEYRKPEFAVTVTPVKPRYSRGDVPEFTVDAAYYFGAPVGGAKVSYEVTREPSWYYEEADSWDADLPDTGTPGSMAWDAGDYQGGEIVTSGKARLDDAGKLVIRATQDEETQKPDREAQKRPALWNDDTMDWRYTLHATVTDEAKRDEVGDGSVTVTQGDFRLQLGADYLVKPGGVAAVNIQAVDYDGKPVPGVHGEATLERLEWTRHAEQSILEGTLPWTADAAGKAVVGVTPTQEGSYRVKVTTHDARGQRIVASQWLWVMNDDGGGFEYPYQDLDVRADKRIYCEGDTARIIINTKHVHRTALLTFESGDMLTYRTLTIDKPSTIVKVPVTEALLPNIAVGVCFVDGKEFYHGEATLNVSRISKALKVSVTPAKPRYGPGEVAEFHIKTTTPNGRPASAEVSLGLVDEAIYAIAPDDTENIVANFYPRRYNPVRTVFSFPDVYMSGDDKAGSTIRTRSYFPDTAYWNPEIVTDAAGEATISVPLPDNLTTWRATVCAATLDTRVGQGTGSIIVTKPFLVRLETPRFLTSGDSVNIAVVAHNNTDKPLTAQVGLGGEGVQVDGAAVQHVSLAPGKAQRVIWRVHADAVGQIKLRGWGQAVEDVKLADAMSLTLPVKLKGRPEAESHAGKLTDTATLSFTTAKNPVPGSKTLTIRLAPSQASAMLGALEYLAKYPYGCTEQTMSCFLPDVLVAGLLKQEGGENAKLSAELPKMVNTGLLRLYAYQHDDGGWGWWEHDESDAWMTAYVVFGLRQAHAAGYPVTPRVEEEAVKALRDLAVKPELAQEPDKLAFAAYVLALAGEGEAARTALANLARAQAAPKPPEMRVWSWSALALARQLLGLDAGDALRHAWAAYDAVQAGHAPRDYWYDTYQLSDEAALLLFADTNLTPADPRAVGLVDTLMQARDGNHWDSTRATAFTLLALTNYFATNHALHPNETVNVAVNGAHLATVQFTAEDLLRPERVLTVRAAELGTVPPVVTLQRTGTGEVYYTALLEYTEQSGLDQPAAGTSDLAISRVYRKYERGTPKTGSSQTHFTLGDVIEVELTITAKRPFRYVMIEDPLPAGCETRDRGPVEDYEWEYWWTNEIMRDDQAGFAVQYLTPGKPHTLTYHIHASASGDFTALPPRVFDMYNPGAWAAGAAQAVTIGE